jgi:hypothetical protein
VIKVSTSRLHEAAAGNSLFRAGTGRHTGPERVPTRGHDSREVTMGSDHDHVWAMWTIDPAPHRACALPTTVTTAPSTRPAA